MEKLLEVNNLSVSFRTHSGMVRAVRDVSFYVNSRETIAIVGESGSGKSVTVKTIMGILAKNAVIDEGEVLYDEQDILKLTEKGYHTIRGKRIGLIFQDPLSALNPIMTIGKQICEVLTIGRGMSKADAKVRALELMRDVGITEPEVRFKQYPFQFSGGMRQRIVIAIALANEPEILICDEPTTALDVTVQSKILELINEIKEKRHMAVVFITHDLGVVANIAERVYVMYAGRIVESGTCNDIFFDPRHPYTWALLSSCQDQSTKGRLLAIPGTPPNMEKPPVGDAFAARNPYAMKIDFEQEPPTFKISETHFAATWLLHPNAPKVEMPDVLRERIDRMLKEEEEFNARN
ncbi:MAG: ABC transporter ATP-binding protein [Clostridia bacterium]